MINTIFYFRQFMQNTHLRHDWTKTSIKICEKYYLICDHLKSVRYKSIQIVSNPGIQAVQIYAYSTLNKNDTNDASDTSFVF